MAEEVKKIPMQDYFNQEILPKIGDYYFDYSPQFDYKVTTKCPLHDEDTPSFRYFSETNSYYCFGCGSGGDVIKLHMAFRDKHGNRQNFADSVKYLYRKFVEGKEVLEVVSDKLISKTEELSSPREMAKLSIQLIKAEKMTIKEVSYNVDLVEMLVSKNKLSALQGIDYLKECIKKAKSEGRNE